MKRIISLFLTVLMVITVITGSACAQSFKTATVTKGDGSKVISTLVTKTTGIGTAATGNINAITSNAKFVLRVRKDTGYNASNTTTVSSKTDFRMTTLKDGNGQSLLRKGYDYKLAYNLSSTSTADSGSCGGNWYP